MQESDLENKNNSSNPANNSKHVKYRAEYINFDFYPMAMPRNFADQIFEACNALPWQRQNMRTTITFGNPGLTYTVQFGKNPPYSEAVRPWDELSFFKILKPYLEQVTQKQYNFCAINRYPNGNAGIGLHRDKELATGTTITGVSVGAERDFIVQLPKYINSDPIRLKLFHGSMYSMNPPTNERCYHSVPIQPEISGIRYSLTFRDAEPDNFETVPVAPVIKCVALLKSGPRQGEACNAAVRGDGNLCGRHNK